MKIQNLKDLKTALNKVPDEKLQTYIFVPFDDGIGITTTQGQEDNTYDLIWQRDMETHKELDMIVAWFDKIIEKAIKIYNEEDTDDEPVSVDTEDEDYND